MAEAQTLRKKTVVYGLHPSDAVRTALLDRGYISSLAVSREPKYRFMQKTADFLQKKDAEKIYEKAQARAVLLAHAAAAAGTTEGSAAYRALHDRLSQKTDEKTLFEDMPDYQEIYGSLDYCSCPKCKSIFGPGAYFIDLMRIIECHIELEPDGQSVPLKKRRPDLYDLKISCENTNQTKPYLSCVNEILEAYLGMDEIERVLAKKCCPYPLPYIHPLAQVRACLLEEQAELSDIFRVLLLPEESIWMEEVRITPDVYDYLSAPLSEDKMKKFWGIVDTDVERLSNLAVFLKETGLKRQDADRLFYQDITEDEPDREKKLHALYLNQGLEDGGYLHIKEDSIQNLQADTLKRICGFLRMCQVFGVDYADMDGLIQAAGYDAQGKLCIFKIGQILKLTRIFSITAEEAAALTAPMRDRGSGLFMQVYGMTRAEFDGMEQQLRERHLQKSLALSADAFSALCIYFQNADVYQNKQSNFPDAAYRHAKLAHLFGMPLETWIRFLSLAFPEPVEVFLPEQIIELLTLCQGLPYSIYELEYLVTLKQSPYLAAGITMQELSAEIMLLRQGAEAGQEEDTQQADYVYGRLGTMMGLQPSDVKEIFQLLLTKEEMDQWPVKVLKSALEELKPVMDQAYRLVYLVRKGIGLPLLGAALVCGEGFGMTDCKVWTLDFLRSLTFFADYSRKCQDSQEQLPAFVKSYVQNKDISLLAEVSGWDKQETESIMRLLYPEGKEETNISALILALANCMACEQKLSVHADALEKLKGLAHLPDTVYEPDAYYAYAQSCQESLFGSSLSENAEAALAKSKRDALLPVVMQKLQETYADITDYHKLYKYFLIDVEMDEKTLISPVKEGINALQLYLQRCRLRLEKGVRDITVPQSWWEWVMDYRMWEANRRVFVYPENYLIPSLRKSKTGLFKNTEDALCQSKITDGYIEQQYVKYLDDYMELTQLKICGAYETEEDNINVLYVFARTKKQPYTYYYCRKESTLAWSEWTKIDTNIDAENITPVFVFNRLHIFWPVVKENTKVKVTSGDTLQTENEKSYTLQIKYTYRNLQGKWITPQNLQEDTVIFSKGDGGTKYLEEASDKLGIRMEDHSFENLTLLRLTHHNLDGVLDKGAGFECLAVITGSFARNLGRFMEEVGEDSTLDQEQEAFTKSVSRMIDNHNFEIYNGEDGSFSTGFFKLFNEEMEEIHLIHGREFIVVDSYTTPNHSLLYKPVHDAVHHAVGLMLSQDVLKDAALPAKGLLSFDNQDAGPALDKHVFVAEDDAGKLVIDQDMSEKIYETLEDNGFIEDSHTSQMGIANQSLQYVLDDLLIDGTQKGAEDYAARANQIRHIQDVLLKNLGAVYLFKNAQNAAVIPVVNQPGKFIYDCGDEAFLVYPVYRRDGADAYDPVNICKVDKGITIGVPVTVTTFVKLGFDRRTAGNIYDALCESGLLNKYDIVDMDTCSREKLSEVLKDILDDNGSSAFEQKLSQIYTKLRNYPVIQKMFTGLRADTDSVISALIENGILYPWGDSQDTYRIDLDMMRKKNRIQFKNPQGGTLDAREEAGIYEELQNAVSSIHFNYRLNDDLPDEWKELPFSEWKFGVERLTNPTIKKLKHKLEAGGISAFLNRKTQSEPEEPMMPFARLQPGQNVIQPNAKDGAQIDFDGLYAEYNWELFYHIPILIAQNFRTNSLYEDSMKWFHYIFDPTKKRDDSLQRYYWNFYPFSYSRQQQMKEILTNPSAIQAYNDSPFDPHAIARLRIDAYGKYTIIEYINNIIAWGDSLFMENTWESLTRATMMYVWANDLLGPRPERIGEQKQQKPRSYAEIETFYQDPANIPQFLLELEEQIAQMDLELFPVQDHVPLMDIQAYFGVPENEQMLLLWDTVEDRLYKLRHSLDINGAPRITKLFEPAADVTALVKSAAAAADAPPGVLAKQCGIYPYRFTYIIEQAKSVTSLLMQFSSSLLSAMERQDAETLLLMSGAQEEVLMDMAVSVKENQIEELERTMASLNVSKAAAAQRQAYYKKNADEYMSEKETAGFAMSTAAAVMDTTAGGMALAAGAARLVPQVGSPFAMKYGGVEIGSSMETIAHGFGMMAGVLMQTSQQVLTMAGYDRRKEEWMLQADAADKEIQSLDEQIASCQARLKAAQKDLDIHRRTQEQKKEVLDYLKQKFTGAQLYQWLTAHLSSAAWQVYQLALELGLTAQEAYQYEKDTSDTFLKYDYWDSGRKGLMAGESLMISLVQMQQSYMKNDCRRLEIEKQISLAHMFPQAFDTLKKEGSCQFVLSESVFAADYPGAYRRKIKSISLSIPAVLPPYENIRAVLRQTESIVLLKPDKKGIDYLFGITSEEPGGGVIKKSARIGEKIAVSKGIDDSGVFALDFSDPRYLPFEGTGAASSWYLEMPQECNHFAMDTITDIVLCIKYTALEEESRGSGSFYEYVASKIKRGECV